LNILLHTEGKTFHLLAYLMATVASSTSNKPTTIRHTNTYACPWPIYPDTCYATSVEASSWQ